MGVGGRCGSLWVVWLIGSDDKVRVTAVWYGTTHSNQPAAVHSLVLHRGHHSLGQPVARRRGYLQIGGRQCMQ